jgi:ABC-type sugar transport system ATPase subunit
VLNGFRPNTPADPPAEVGVRPEHVRLGGGDEITLEGRAVTVERLGAESFVYLDVGQDEPLVVKVLGETAVKPGDAVPAGIPPAALYLFDADGRCYPRQTFH